MQQNSFIIMWNGNAWAGKRTISGKYGVNQCRLTKNDANTRAESMEFIKITHDKHEFIMKLKHYCVDVIQTNR